jgi:hypothetical protein
MREPRRRDGSASYRPASSRGKRCRDRVLFGGRRVGILRLAISLFQQLKIHARLGPPPRAHLSRGCPYEVVQAVEPLGGSGHNANSRGRPIPRRAASALSAARRRLAWSHRQALQYGCPLRPASQSLDIDKQKMGQILRRSSASLVSDGHAAGTCLNSSGRPRGWS